MVGEPWRIALAFVTACFGIFLMSSAVQGWFMGRMHWLPRIALLAGAILMIKGGLETDAIGIAIAIAVGLLQYRIGRREPIPAAQQ
jgi:TRAP-type uncharacterized transport system fused permease subunit